MRRKSFPEPRNSVLKIIASRAPRCLSCPVIRGFIGGLLACLLVNPVAAAGPRQIPRKTRASLARSAASPPVAMEARAKNAANSSPGADRIFIPADMPS